MPAVIMTVPRPANTSSMKLSPVGASVPVLGAGVGWVGCGVVNENGKTGEDPAEVVMLIV